MWGKLEHAIKDERATLEENVSPVPPVILDDLVGLGFDPQVEGNQRDTPDPPWTITIEFMSGIETR